MSRVGLQLYTIREECSRDLAGTLRRLGAQGYEGVELFDLHGHDPDRVRGWLDDAGLVAAGRHAPLAMLEGDLPRLVDELDALGTDRLALSWVDPEAVEQPEPLVERIAAIARAAHENGLRFGFHNHWAELERADGGATFLDRLRELPSELLWLELDLGWVWFAGVDPLDELERSHGRCPLVHVKDFRSRTHNDNVPVGEGIVGYDRVVPAAVAAGAEWLIVEQDEVDGEPFEIVERSLATIRKLVA